MDYLTIAAAFPVIAVAVPPVVQFLKLFFDKWLLKTYPYQHDLIVRIVTFVVAAIVGIGALVVTHANPTTLQDWFLTVGVVGAYGIGGGASAQGIYGLLNLWLHQSPVVAKPSATLVASTTNTTTSPNPNAQRQPY